MHYLITTRYVVPALRDSYFHRMLRLYLFKLAFRIKGLSPAHLSPTPVALYLATRAYGIVVERSSH
nr:MAG TPA: hypothetical protein [Caudoviricetes sp.]